MFIQWRQLYIQPAVLSVQLPRAASYISSFVNSIIDWIEEFMTGNDKRMESQIEIEFSASIIS
jgi:hypothetical protein